MSEIAQDDPPVSVPLPEKLDYAACCELCERLGAQTDAGLSIDASLVSFLSARAVEILLVAQARCAESGLSFFVSDPSASFTSSLAALGLDHNDLKFEGET